jgi:hypothetical protein
MEQSSEVARMQRTIEKEYTAAQRALNAPAMVVKHAFITARMGNVQQTHATLRTLVGEAAATRLVAETRENA